MSRLVVHSFTNHHEKHLREAPPTSLGMGDTGGDTTLAPHPTFTHTLPAVSVPEWAARITWSAGRPGGWWWGSRTPPGGQDGPSLSR
jgi:hypothetical protein